MARREKYKTHVEPKLDLIVSWRETGLSEEDIATLKLKIAYSTLRVYKEKYPALKAALDTSREVLGAKIKKGLWKEAIGYEYVETSEQIESIIDKNGKDTGKRKVKRVKTTKWARPSSNLVIFALCNLLPEEFKRVDKEVVDDLKNKIDDLGDSVKNKIELSNSKVNEMLEVLYGKAIDESIKNKKELESK